MDQIDAERHLVTREVRMLVTEDQGQQNGYAALYTVLPDGQWSLALDGSWGTAEERTQMLSDITTLLGFNLGILGQLWSFKR